MRAKGFSILRLAAFGGCIAFASLGARGQFLQPPETNFFGDEFVKTVDVRAVPPGNPAIPGLAPAPAPAPIPGLEPIPRPAPKTEGYEHLLIFRDGRQLRGRLQSVGHEEIIWSHPDFSEPLRLRRSDAQCVYLKPGNLNGEQEEVVETLAPPELAPNPNAAASAPARADHGTAPYRPVPATVMLGGDDWLRGFVTSPDGQTFTVRLLNDKGTSIATPRSHMDWLFFDWNEARGGGFDGSIQNAQDWLAAAPSAVLLDDGTLMISNSEEWFGRLLPQPPLFEVSMEIPAGAERESHLWLQPPPPTPDAPTFGAVDLEWSEKQLSLRRRSLLTNEVAQQNFPISEASGADPKGMVHDRIFYNSDTTRIVIFRNGRKVADWMPERLKTGDGPPDAIAQQAMQIANSLIQMSVRNLATGAAIAGIVNTSCPSVDCLCLGSIPGLIATAPISCFTAQFLIQQHQARFPRIMGFCLSHGSKSQGAGKSNLKIHRFRVSPWNGALPREGEISSTHDELSSASLGLIPGKLASITEKDIVFSERSEPKLPGTLLRLPHESSAPWRPVARANLGAAGELSVSALNIREGKAHLRAAFAEDAEVPLAMLDSIRFPAAGRPAGAQWDALVFKNGDEVEGSLVSVGSGAPLRWKLPGGQQVEIGVKKIAGIRLASPPSSKPKAEGALVELRNGDRLRCSVVSFDVNQLVLDEPLVGRLSVERSRIWKLFPHTLAGIRDGADDPAGWMSVNVQPGLLLASSPQPTASDPGTAWLYLDGCYLPRQAQSASREGDPRFLSCSVPHQDSGLFEVRAEITGTDGAVPNAILSIQGIQNESGPTSAVSVSFANMEIYVNIMNARGQKVRQTQIGPKFPSLSTRLSFRVFVNSVAGTADVLLNGVLVTRIGQQADERSPGINFTALFGGLGADGSPAILSNLWVGPWDGELPQADTAWHACTTLANGDASTNIPTVLEQGNYLLETEVGPVRMPAASVSAIAFGGKPEHGHCAARLRLVDGSVVHVSSFECRDRALTSRSEIFADLHLPLESVAEIILDPAPAREPPGPPPKKPAPGPGPTGAAAP